MNTKLTMPRSADEPLNNEQFDSVSCYDEEQNKMYFLDAERPFINVREIPLSYMESRGIIFSFALIPFIWAPREMIKFTIEGLPLAKYVTSDFPYYNRFIFMCPPYSSNLFKFVYFEADIIESETCGKATFYVENQARRFYSFQEEEAICLFNPI